MYPMRMKAGDIKTRVIASRLAYRINEYPEISRELGLEDITKYPDYTADTETDPAEKELQEEKELC